MDLNEIDNDLKKNELENLATKYMLLKENLQKSFFERMVSIFYNNGISINWERWIIFEPDPGHESVLTWCGCGCCCISGCLFVLLVENVQTVAGA